MKETLKLSHRLVDPVPQSRIRDTAHGRDIKDGNLDTHMKAIIQF